MGQSGSDLRGRRQARNCRAQRFGYTLLMSSELVFNVAQESDGGFCAECLSEPIATEGDSWADLRRNVEEAVRGYYFDQPTKLPASIRLHLVRDEVFPVAA